MATNFEVRLLLVLWDLGGASVRKGELNSRFSGKAADVNTACANLLKIGAIESSEKGRFLTLTSIGKILLSDSLTGDEFNFEAQIGAKMANAMLKWLRSQTDKSGLTISKQLQSESVGKSIDAYEEFKSVALETYDRLNRGFNFDDLVPIYQIRRDIGDRIKRQDFNLWLLEMQADDIFQLQGGSVSDGDAGKIEDSITTELSGLRCYATLLNT
jgi:hypothetical protein